MMTSGRPDILLATSRPRIKLLKLSLAFTLLVGLYVWTPYNVLAQGNNLPNRVSSLEGRADDHDAQLVELRSNVATIGARATGSLKLVGMDLQNTDVELTPTPLSNGRSRYLSDPLAKVPVPASDARTHLLIVAGAVYSWHQVASDQAYQCGNAVFVSFKSAALTDAGLASDTISFAIGTDQQFDDAASTVGVTRGKDSIWTVGVPVSVFAAFLNGTFGPRATINGQPITDAQALEIATAMMRSAMEIQVRARATTRSVDSFTVSQGTLQVWSDGN